MTETKSKTIPKTTATKKSTPKSSSARKPARKSVNATEFLAMIATNAYYRAESRGFAPGDDMQDWLDAESEISQKFIQKKSTKE